MKVLDGVTVDSNDELSFARLNPIDGDVLVQAGVIRTTVANGTFVHSTDFMQTNSPQTLDFNNATEIYPSYMDIVQTAEVESKWYTEQAKPEGTAQEATYTYTGLEPVAGGLKMTADPATIDFTNYPKTISSVSSNIAQLTVSFITGVATLDQTSTFSPATFAILTCVQSDGGVFTIKIFPYN